MTRIKFYSSVFLAFFVLLFGNAKAQDAERILTQDQYFELIRQYHPIVRQARLLSVEAQAELRMARGGFDPKLFSDIEHKQFDGKNYFLIGEAGFKIPTWYGLELKGAYNWSNGIFLDPENNLPSGGQAIAGVTLTALRGLVIDERRATLEKAKILQQANEAEQISMINDVLMDAAKYYWDWALAYEQLRINQQALEVSRQRLEGIIISFEQGDQPAIDTLETLIQVRNREFNVEQSQLEVQQAGLLLSTFLWLDNDVPLELSEATEPPELSGLLVQPLLVTELQELQLSVNNSHPELLAYAYKIDQLEVDRRLALEQMKPQLDLEYNFLASGLDFRNTNGNGDDRFIQDLLTDNYKWGARFSFPLFLRKERGKLQLTDVKIASANYGLQQKRQDLRNKLEAYFTKVNTLSNQITLYEDQVDDYQRLLEAEREKFRIGESSIFLINSRETKLFDAQLKLAELRSKYQKSRVQLQWIAGLLR